MRLCFHPFTGSCDGDDEVWDAVAEEKTWREELSIMTVGVDGLLWSLELLTVILIRDGEFWFWTVYVV
jgi:hypothetical protein